MDRLRIGRSIRAIRIRKDWRQEDLAVAASVSRSYISKIERGLIRNTDFDKVEVVCEALGAHLDVRVRWHGEGLDRLLDEAHADLVDLTVRLLRKTNWETAVEVTFNEYGDRGSVDVLAWQAATRSLIVGEIKSVIGDAQATLLPLDRKTRLGAKIGRSRGWDAVSVSRLLVVWDSSMNRRRVARVEATFSNAFPMRGWAVRHWLESPGAPISGLLFLANSTGGGGTRRATGRQRVRGSSSSRCPRQ